MLLYNIILSVSLFRVSLVCVCVNWPCLASNVSLKGKNLNKDEYAALGDMFSSLRWDLPDVQEYKNDLVQPNLPICQSLPLSTSSTVAIPDATPDPSSPCCDKQWARANKMAAGFCPNV